MTAKNDLFDGIKHATPCDVPWSSMEGDERVRLCGQCAIHVYNFESMTRDEVTTLVAKSEGKMCARFYRRTDGTIVTSDCPVAFDKLKFRLGLAASSLVSFIGIALGAVAWAARANASSMDVKKIAGVEKICNWATHNPNNPYQPIPGGIRPMTVTTPVPAATPLVQLTKKKKVHP